MIRWSVQKGYITVPKSSKFDRILHNTKVFDWAISPQDIDILVSKNILLFTTLKILIANFF